MKAIWFLALNLYEHGSRRLGFHLARHRSTSALIGDPLIDEINKQWGTGQ